MNTLYRYHIIICHQYHIIYPSPSSFTSSRYSSVFCEFTLIYQIRKQETKTKTFSTRVSLSSSMYLLKWLYIPFRHLYTHFRIKKRKNTRQNAFTGCETSMNRYRTYNVASILNTIYILNWLFIHATFLIFILLLLPPPESI